MQALWVDPQAWQRLTTANISVIYGQKRQCTALYERQGRQRMATLCRDEREADWPNLRWWPAGRVAGQDARTLVGQANSCGQIGTMVHLWACRFLSNEGIFDKKMSHIWPMPPESP